SRPGHVMYSTPLRTSRRPSRDGPSSRQAARLARQLGAQGPPSQPGRPFIEAAARAGCAGPRRSGRPPTRHAPSPHAPSPPGTPPSPRRLPPRGVHGDHGGVAPPAGTALQRGGGGPTILLVAIPVAVPAGTALHRGKLAAPVHCAVVVVAVPAGTALHRGGEW